jgi:2-oxoglutarate/2-oxoacid ferredoxin oxidoreductase subunit alpha
VSDAAIAERAESGDAQELRFISAEEALVEAVLRAGCQLFCVYPMTPINEVNEHFLALAPEYGAISLTCESEMEGGWYAYGAVKAGARVMVGSTGVGMALMGEMVSYAARDGLPIVISHWTRGGPGTGPTGSPSQGDYAQAVKAPANGDFKNVVFAPDSVQELVDFTYQAFDVAELVEGPVTVLTDYSIAKSTEVVALPPRRGPGLRENALTGRRDGGRPRRRMEVRDEGGVTSAAPAVPEEERATRFVHLEVATWRRWDRYTRVQPLVELYRTEDALLNVVAVGTMARIVKVVVNEMREEGLRVGLIRPQTLFPFPAEAIADTARTSRIMVVELSVGQMAEDVQLSIGERPLFYGRPGGVVPTLAEISHELRRVYGDLEATP